MKTLLPFNRWLKVLLPNNLAVDLFTHLVIRFPTVSDISRKTKFTPSKITHFHLITVYDEVISRINPPPPYFFVIIGY